MTLIGNTKPPEKKDREVREKGTQSFNLTVYDESKYTLGNYRSITSHWHQELELFHLLSGQAQVRIAGEDVPIKAGEACFINTSMLHSMELSKNWHYRSYVFGADLVAGAPGSVFDTRYVLPLLTNGPCFFKFSKEDEAFFREFQRIYRACDSQAAGFEFEARFGLSRILAMITEKGRVMPARRAAGEQESRVKEMMSWIEENLGQEITVENIAGAANICPRTCQKAFQRYLHCSPVEYLQRRRILAAAQRLASTNDPVTDIAFDCGFSSHSYFSKSFRAVMGSSPVEYRAAARKTGG